MLFRSLLRDDVVARCQATGSIILDGAEVSLAAAAVVLAAWDGCSNLDSPGAILWRETMAGFTSAELRDAGTLFAHPFDPADPVATPHGLTPAPVDGEDPTVMAVARAVVALDAAGLPIDTTLGNAQWAQRGEHRVAVHGGGEGEGLLNILAPIGALASTAVEPDAPVTAAIPGRTDRTGLRVGGYQVTYGTSFLMAVELTDDGPVGRGLLSYGQSGDDRSEHHADGTRAYRDKATRPLLFHDADIEANPDLIRRTITG